MNPQPVSASRGEAGSAYIIVLLVLIVLAVFGIALSMITQTESQIGSNERTLNRVFYAADAGVERAVARALVAADHSPQASWSSAPRSKSRPSIPSR